MPTHEAESAGNPGGLRSTAQDFDLKRIDRQFLDNPYPVYRALQQHAPLHSMPDGSYFLSRYADCVTVYQDSSIWRSDKRVDFRPLLGDGLLYEHHTTSLVFNDPPYHTRVRRLLAPAFTPRALKALEPRVEALVDLLLDRGAELGRFDLIDNFAAAIPLQLIGDMLGIPEPERGPLRAWSLAILGALEPTLSDEQRARGNAAVADFKAYLADLVRRDRRGGVDGEVLSALIAGTDLSTQGGGDDKLSELELLHNCIFLLNAGHETTTNLIGNGLDLLIRHPEAMQALREQPALIDTAVEEFLRFESPNQLGNRRAASATSLNGVALPAGAYVHIGIGAANRDPAQFPDPDRLDIGRHPNRHLAFAIGIHACAGLSLARMEAQVAIGKFVRRFAAIERAGDYQRGLRARFRGFLHYPIAVR